MHNSRLNSEVTNFEDASIQSFQNKGHGVRHWLNWACWGVSQALVLTLIWALSHWWHLLGLYDTIERSHFDLGGGGGWKAFWEARQELM